MTRTELLPELPEGYYWHLSADGDHLSIRRPGRYPRWRKYDVVAKSPFNISLMRYNDLDVDTYEESLALAGDDLFNEWQTKVRDEQARKQAVERWGR